MKKLFSKLMLVAMAATMFVACEDVPEPYDMPGTGSNTPGSSEIVGAEGTGTLEDPFNAAAALNYGNQLAAGEESDSYMYIKGKVAAITEQYGTQYGNATFTISDDGSAASTTFTIYRALYLGNQKYTSGDLLKEGDDVIICGSVTNFRGNTPETVTGKAYLYSLNGKTEGGGTTPEPQPGGEAKGTGTQADPFNVQAIINFVSALDADVDTKADYYVKGIVTSIPSNGISTQYNNVSFYISDDKGASNSFYVFRAKGLNGGDVTENMIKVGDEVVVFGSTWVNYKGNTPETKQGEAYVVSITPGENSGNPTTGGGEVSGNSITAEMSSFGLSNAEDLTTLTLSDGTTLSFSQEDGTNAPKYYDSGSAARLYAKNSVTISSAKTISKVEFDCVANYTGNDQLTASPGSVAKDGTKVTISNVKASTVKVTNDYTDVKAGTQLRIVSITITYAE